MFWKFITIAMFLNAVACAQNPVFPEGTFIADPAARVWPDGRLYIYGSTDENRNYWCSYSHDLMYSADMITWEKTSKIFSSKGKAGTALHDAPLLFAPDASYRNGKYYLYFCTPDTTISEGVVVSDNPTGPFNDITRLNVGPYREIDPTVFIDDDGQAYYYWGQYTLKGAKLRPDMITIDSGSIRNDLLTRRDHFFHEGSFVFRRNGIYYVVFADESRRDRRPTCLGYATATSPMGPFTYRGVIIDNYGCDPESWNNHGSVVEFKGGWYVFYHRSSQGSQVMRRTCVEPIFFDSSGLIKEVDMTSQGAGRPLSAFSPIEGRRACFLSGYCRIRPHGKKPEVIGDIKSGDMAAFRYIDFGSGVKKIKVVAYAQTGGTILLRKGDANGKVIGKLFIPPPLPEQKMEYREYESSIAGATGTCALWMEFKGGEKGVRLFNLDKFWFE